MKIVIGLAQENESDQLTLISFAAKRYWKYPEEYFDVWKDELTITKDYIDQNKVYVARSDGSAVGFISIVEVKNHVRLGNLLIQKGFWLDHVFVYPPFIGKGVGTQLMLFAKEVCKQNNIKCLYILSDPNAKGFYDRIGAQYIGEVPSNIKGRNVSLFILK